MAKKRLGELLLERGVITAEQLSEGLRAQRLWGQRLGAVLVHQGAVAEGTLTRSLAESLKIPLVDLSKVVPEQDALKSLPAQLAEEHEIFPIAVKEHRGRKTLLLAMADPLNMNVIDEIAFRSSLHVRPAIAQLSSLRAAISKYYRGLPGEIPALNYKKIDPEAESIAVVNYTGREHIVDFDTIEFPAVQKPSPFDSKAQEPATEAKSAVVKTPLGTPLSHLSMPETPAYLNQDSDYEIEQVASEFDQKTGVYMVQSANPEPSNDLFDDDPFAIDVQESSLEMEQLRSLEKKFWALMRILSKNGAVTRDQFLEELTKGE